MEEPNARWHIRPQTVAATMEVIAMKTGRRLLIGGLGIMVTLSLIGGVALAGTQTATVQHTTLVRGDPYYWVKCEQERLGLCLYAGTEAEAGFRLQVASERLDEAAQLMQQSRFAEANAALERYRWQIQAMNRAMVSVRERAASQTAGNVEPGSGQSNGKTPVRTGWLEPGEVVARVEQMTRAQLQVLNRLCDGSQEQIREQARLALEECTRTCTREQAGQSNPSPPDQTTGSNNGSDNSAASSPNSNSSVVREQYQTQEQQQTQEQTQGQNQKQEQQRENGPANTEQQSCPNQPPTPGQAEPQPHQGK